MLSLLFKMPALPMAVTGEQQSSARTVAGAIMMMDLRSQRNEYPAPVRLDVVADEFREADCWLWIGNSVL